MKKLIILQGPPASGKSTWTNEYMKDHENDTVVVSRDAIRHKMGPYSMEHEKKVTIKEEEQTLEAMSKGLDIINDATNLNPKYLPKWETMAKDHGYEVEYKQFYIPYAEAVKRDMNPDREHSVGKAVIKRFYQAYYKDQLESENKKTVEHFRLPIDKTLPPAVMCDLDGTLAWMQNRSPYSTTEVGNDKVDERLAQLLEKLMMADITILFVSGRMGTKECREQTLAWIRSHIQGYKVFKLFNTYEKFELFMRKDGDYRSDDIVKKEIYDRNIKENYDVICVFDDRNKVVNMWRETGLLCCQVAEGDF